MKSLKVAKFQLSEALPSIRNFYLIILAVVALMTVLNASSDGNARFTGIDSATFVFLFISGLNVVKSQFGFAQANNISRKTFFEGTLMSVLAIAFFMSVIDVAANRIFNLMLPCPSSFDMSYGACRDILLTQGEFSWTPTNHISILFATLIWQFALYTMTFILGIFIRLIYYRSNKMLQIMISCAPIILLMFSRSIVMAVPAPFWTGLRRLFVTAFGVESGNPYMAVLSYLILSGAFAGLAYLLIRRAEVKQ